tara:strand:- start:153 stop:455 length:303 start_codon:yes stop_codon:yes gene_type:complete
MIYIRVRSINIDVLPDAEPFVLVRTEKVITDGTAIMQVIGDFDRIYKRMSDMPNLPVGTMADDGIIESAEMYTMLATISYIWLMEKYGGEIIDNKLVIER